MKDENGQSLVCMHCGEQAIVLYGPRNLPLCFEHFNAAIKVLRDMMMKRFHKAGGIGGNNGER